MVFIYFTLGFLRRGVKSSFTLVSFMAIWLWIPDANAIPIKGRVLNDKKKPLVGAPIYSLGKGIFAVTDEKGRFTIEAEVGERLLTGYSGFEWQIYEPKSSEEIRITLKPLGLYKQGSPFDTDSQNKQEPQQTAELQVSTPEPKDEIYTVVEIQPSFPGGETIFRQYLAQNVNYPLEAASKKIEGRVFVSFVVTQTGLIKDVNILKGLGGGCDEEAIRVVKNMPRWVPGWLNGKPVAVKYNLPVNLSSANKPPKGTK